MNKKIQIFTSETCVYCHEAKKYLNNLGIDYEERNVSIDPVARKELISKGFMGVPVIMVQDEIIQGFDKEKLDNLLK